jgi:putative N6-adenine-specific DNA methylase
MKQINNRLFATTTKGAELALVKELQHLGVTNTTEKPGGVSFSGDLADAYKANMWLRTANKVLIPLVEFVTSSEEQLYKGALKINWREHLELGMTFAVDASARNSKITHSKYAALKVKDAIADQFRNKMGKRPDVNPANPDLLINVHIAKDVCTISLDSSGESLNKRGYRVGSVEAPMRETLAAALVELSEWDAKTPFVDPMCGSGTILIEAALKATNTAPGLIRRRFAFKRWPNFSKKAWDDIIRDAERKIKKDDIPLIIGHDISKRALVVANENLKAADLVGAVKLRSGNISEFRPPQGPGTIIVNPPYGERIGEVRELEELYKTIGDVFKQNCKGYQAFIFTGNLSLAKKVGLKTSRRIPLYNGPIESRFLKYDLY